MPTPHRSVHVVTCIVIVGHWTQCDYCAKMGLPFAQKLSDVTYHVPPCWPQTCRELLAAGFKVRAGARNVEAAKSDSNTAAQFGLISGDQLKNLSWVKLDLEEPDSIASAIGNASKVSRGKINTFRMLVS